jgi:lipoprotein-anchoring transpeptidase ErfK/SrfK
MQTKRPTFALSAMVGVVLLATTLAGCGSTPGKSAGEGSSPQPTSGASAPSTGASAPKAPAKVTLKPNVKKGAKGVEVDTVVSVKAAEGTVSKVKLWTKAKDKSGDTKTVKVPGTLSQDGSSWTASSALDPGSKYRLEMEGKNASDQAAVSSTSTFTTEKLGMDDQTFATIQPAKGSTVGIGMPVILTFDVAVKKRKEFEKRLSVTSTGNQEGTWSWYDSKTVHFRPKAYWKAGTKVSVKANLNGVNAGKGVYGQNSTSTSFTVGKSVITKVNLKTHKAKVYINGKHARTIPISAGKAGWRSRSGTKLISQKLRMTRMTNEAIGASEEYDFQVPYAMRVTNSGEFLHAAPWKEGKGQFGNRNTSHGCVGMATRDARWLFNKVRLGDPVITTGSGKKLEKGNGLTDWNVSYQEFKKGSAL